MTTHIIADKIDFSLQPHTEKRFGEVCLGVYSKSNFNGLNLKTKRLGSLFESSWEDFQPFECSIPIFLVFAQEEEVHTVNLRIAIFTEENLYSDKF